MKKSLVILMLVISLLASLALFSSCDVITLGSPTGDTPDTPDIPDIPDDPEIPDENVTPDLTPEPEIEYVNIILREPTNGTSFKMIKVEKGTAPDLDIVDTVLNAKYNGYSFAGWYYTLLFDKSFDPTLILYEDVELWGDRSNLAGENVVWSYDTETLTLTISGSGDMFDFLYSNDAPWIQYAKLAENIVFEGDITSIGDNSFYGFEAITSVEIPKTVTRIGNNAFYMATALVEVNFPEVLETIDENAFYKCYSLGDLVFNDGLTFVGYAAFYECFSVTRVTITDKIAEFGASAFYNCKNLKTAYYLGIEEDYKNLIFRLDNFWVNQLANTYFFSENKPTEPGPYWYYDEEGQIAQWYYTVSFKAPGHILPFANDYVDATLGVQQSNIDFMENIVYHGYKFTGFSGTTYKLGTILTNDIHLTGNRGNVCGDNLTWRFSGTTLTISGEGAMWDFEGAQDAPWYGRNVVNINIGSKVTHLGSNMFSYMNSLISVDIPTNVTSIHKNAFLGCNNLLYIYYAGTAEELSHLEGADELEGLQNANIYSYATDDVGDGYYWRMVLGGMEVASKRVAWSLIDGALSVGGDAALVNYSSVEETPWYPNRESINSVTVISGANRVGCNSFFGMDKVVSISVPSTVMKIASSAFEGTGYYIDKSNWNSGALYISNHLIKVDSESVGTRFVIKDGTVSIAEGAFEGCTSITELVFVKETLGIYKDALAPLSLKSIFFTGSDASTWEGIWNSGNNLESQDIADAKIYYMSPLEPDTVGSYWYKSMKSDGTFEIVIWEDVTSPEAPEGPEEPENPDEL